jgi:hypothetical protein
LRLFNDQRPALHKPAAKFLDGLFRALVGFGFDESEAAWPLGVPVKRNADAAHDDVLRKENLFQFLLVDVVGEVPYEKARSHELLPRSCFSARPS